jgi:nicotinate-nucleotide adenylyltransferase
MPKALSQPIGLLGGTFDPIHHGHVRFAEDARARLALAEVRLIPTGNPPHRSPPTSSAADRLAMTRLAVEGLAGLTVDDREVRRPGASYTVDTLAELKAELPATPLCLLVGADALAGLASWHRWRELFALAHVVFAARPGALALHRMPPEVAAEVSGRLTHDPAQLGEKIGGCAFHLEIRPHLLSASGLRKRLAAGEKPADLLPPAVLAYIESHHLYRTDPPPTDAH